MEEGTLKEENAELDLKDFDLSATGNQIYNPIT